MWGSFIIMKSHYLNLLSELKKKRSGKEGIWSLCYCLLCKIRTFYIFSIP